MLSHKQGVVAGTFSHALLLVRSDIERGKRATDFNDGEAYPDLMVAGASRIMVSWSW